MRLLAGGGGIVFVTVLGNLDGAVQWFTRLAANAGPNRLRAGWDWLGQTVGNLLRGEPPPGFDYWHSTRLIEGAIHEFPFFTFLYGDLHPHVLALPFTMVIPVLALAFVLSYRLNPIERVQSSGPTLLEWLRPLLRFPTLPLLLLSGFVLGFLRTANTWDYPTYALLLGGAVVLVERRGLIRLEVPASVRLVAAAIGLYLVGRLAFGPYLDNYQSFFLGVRSIDDQTPLWQYLVIHGVLLLLRCHLSGAGIVPVACCVRFPPNCHPGCAADYARQRAVAATDRALAANHDPVGVAGGAGSSRQAPRRLLAGMVALAAVLGIFPEFLAIDGDVGRMNTVFKFYLQAWNLLALAAAATLPLLWQQARLRRFLLPIGALLVLLALLYRSRQFPTAPSSG